MKYGLPGVRVRAIAIALILIGGVLAIGLPAGLRSSTVAASQSAAPSGIQKIQHVIIIMQENRSFDNYFGTYPGADGIPMANGTPTTCVPDPQTKQCVYPYHDTADVNYGGPHDATATAGDIAGGAMNGFIAQAEQYCSTHPKWLNPACQGTPGGAWDAVSYHTDAEIPNYWAYARNFVLQDHMFASSNSNSLSAHLAMVSAWVALCSQRGVPSSCVTSSNPAGIIDWLSTPTPQPVPDYAWTDLTYLLHNHKNAGGNPAPISWAYYVAPGTVPDCPNGGAVCDPVEPITGTYAFWNPLQFFDTVHQDGESGNIQPVTNLYAAAARGTLPSVAWVVPDDKTSEHPVDSRGSVTGGTISDGQAYVTGVINSIMRSPEWNSTAIFLAWDEWGGFYDNVVPPQIDQLGYGLRVPALVISPYARSGYIDHQVLSFDSYLKFIEDDFLGSQRLDPKNDGRPDPRPDVRENAPQLGDLVNDFDFTQSPRPPLILTPYPNGTPTPMPTATSHP